MKTRSVRMSLVNACEVGSDFVYDWLCSLSYIALYAVTSILVAPVNAAYLVFKRHKSLWLKE